MAASNTDQLVLGKTSQEDLECSICIHRFREPKVLDCLHTFCLKCLQELRKHQDSQSKVLKCPLCKQETTLTGKRVTDLPSYFTLGALVEEVTMQERLLGGQGSWIKCQGCKKGHSAVSKCVDCDYFLCKECQEGHKRWPSMKSHETYSLAQLQSGETVYQSKLRKEVLKCSKHPNQNLSFYCKTCEKLVCATCSVLEHGNHSLVGLSEALEKCKQDVAELAAESEKKTTELVTVVRQMKESCKKLDTMFAGTNFKISKKADVEVAKKEEEVTRIRQEIAKIRDEEQKLKRRAMEVYKKRVKMFETAIATNNQEVSQSKSKLDKVNQLMSQASCCEILDLKQKLLNNLKELTRKRPERVPSRLYFVDFEGDCDEGLLGKLLQESKWGLKTEIKTFGPNQVEFKGASYVAAFSNNDVAVVDTWNQMLITCTFKQTCTPGSTILLQSSIHKGVIGKVLLANKDDQLVVLDGHRVKTLTMANQILHQFTTDVEPTCLAVDDNNLTAVGYWRKGEISLHRPDGSLVRRLPAPGIDSCLTTYKQRLIYASKEGSRGLCVQAVDYNGSKVFASSVKRVGPDEPLIPLQRYFLYLHGVCCESDGSIYVSLQWTRRSFHPVIALWDYAYTGKILQFSPGGDFIRCVIQESHPIVGITFTPAGDLVAAAKSCVKIYHHL